MLKVNDKNLMHNLETYMDLVTDENETLVIKRKGNKNVIMISEETYNNLMENFHLIENKENFDWLMQSKMQLGKGMKPKL